MTTYKINFERDGFAGKWEKEADAFTGEWEIELDEDDIDAGRECVGSDASERDVVESAASIRQERDFYEIYPGAPETICFAAKLAQ